MALLITTPATAQTIAITGGTVAIGDGSAPIERGTVIVRDGRIVSAGAGVAVPAGAQVVDATGKWVSTGIVAGFTRLGIVEVDGVSQTDDTGANNSIWSAAIDIVPAINPRSTPIAINRVEGVTRAIVSPSAAATMFAGQGAVIDLGADMNAVTKPRAFQFVEFGETGAREAGGSRPALFLQFRSALQAAQAYARAPTAYDGGNSKNAILTKADAAALVPVVNGATPLLVHVERGSDILAVLDLKKEFPALKLVLVGAVEGWTVAKEIAASGVPVIASALADLPDSFETLAATQSNIGRMKAAGVKVSIGMINDDEVRMAFRSSQYAGNLVALTKVPGATGLDWAAAFAAITSGPAEALGLGSEIGSLRAGRRADVVLWNGDPLEITSAPERVWIDGVEQPMETRQTKLRDRYRTPVEGNLPKAYER
ncbi:imidazolonepropionase-like amidohydrolase [Sphingobium boeckii]|uniref:Imidazolonepropionase-like amidohydrolase n=1 Tax=Sphingobium boeckii TaxID=1082345 RepID=A0A7W9AGP3_9SPHN|nr:amidohydrolase family protein [Sphingobium boeckii]MBB5685290.1 imidazolonepropionase-like amidohydrolase [Sphingobium boeckii]